jgi:Pyruvate/2-oxoglutarate dehydrogenase complex, dehydrogenase (E1) component, eukaryotic type, beta subunit
MKRLSYAEAIREALMEEMRRDPRVFLLGEDIGTYGGSQKVTRGLIDEFGSERVIDSPISENAIVGMGMGAAMGGLRPVVEIMYMDFLPIAAEQILNHVAQAFFVSGGQVEVPLLIRTQYSMGRVHGPQHSQFFPSWFINIPGLWVIAPSGPRDAKGLTKAAIRCNRPVLSIECARLYHKVKEEIPEEDYEIPFGTADIKRRGKDVTIIAISRTVHEALNAASELEENHGIDVEIVDPRSLKPLDVKTILSSVKKTGRVIITSDEYRTGSVTSEMSSLICENAFKDLKSSPVRLTSPDMHVPFSESLEEAYMIGTDDIVDAAQRIMEADQI